MGSQLTDLAGSHVAVPPMPAQALYNLESLAMGAAALLGDCDCDLIRGCDGAPMLIVMPRDGCAESPTWVTTAVTGVTFRLEALVDEARFDLLAEAPPNRILTVLAALAEQARNTARTRTAAT